MELGSSPRIRGKFSVCFVVVTANGIIPANTGKILNELVDVHALQDHPREYGENSPLPALCFPL